MARDPQNGAALLQAAGLPANQIDGPRASGVRVNARNCERQRPYIEKKSGGVRGKGMDIEQLDS